MSLFINCIKVTAHQPSEQDPTNVVQFRILIFFYFSVECIAIRKRVEQSEGKKQLSEFPQHRGLPFDSELLP